jgi:hypothetical protein
MFSDSLIDELLVTYWSDMENAGTFDIENQYQVGKDRLASVLTPEQQRATEHLDMLCRIEAEIALHISFERGLYAGFQHFFQRDAEPLTFEHFVLDKLLTVPEMKQFPDYYEARMKVNELETQLADQLDPFSREHLTSITYAWEERTTAMLRYGFALGYHKSADVIRQVEPELAGRVTEACWKVKRDTLQF